MQKLNLQKEEHNEVMRDLILLYYTEGSLKSIWEEECTGLRNRITQYFNVATDDELLDFLAEHEDIYTDYTRLKVAIQGV